MKLYEARDLLRRGARELDMVIALPNLISREFQHVQTELMQASEACRREGATLKIILNAAYLSEDLKIIACGCCERAEVDFVAGSTREDAELLRRHLPEEIGVKMTCETVGVDPVLEFYEAGCSRIGTVSTAALLDEWKARFQG